MAKLSEDLRQKKTNLARDMKKVLAAAKILYEACQQAGHCEAAEAACDVVNLMEEAVKCLKDVY